MQYKTQIPRNLLHWKSTKHMHYSGGSDCINTRYSLTLTSVSKCNLSIEKENRNHKVKYKVCDNAFMMDFKSQKSGSIFLTSIPRCVIRTAFQEKETTQVHKYKSNHHKVSEFNDLINRHAYPNITAFQSIILLS